MDNVKDQLDAAWRDTPRGCRIVLTLALILIFFLATVGVLAIASGAHASCTRNGDTCPAPSAFATKYKAGYFKRMHHGLPVKKVFRRPARARHLFVLGYERLYDNASPRRKRALREHAVWISQHLKLATCLTLQCMAVLEWQNLIDNTRCSGVFSMPDLMNPGACIRPYTNTQHWPSWTDVRRGLALAACSTATGAAIVVSVGSDAAGAPPLVAMTTGIGCGVSYWETLSGD